MRPALNRRSAAAALAAVVVVGVLITGGLASAGTSPGMYTGCLKSGVISNVAANSDTPVGGPAQARRRRSPGTPPGSWARSDRGSDRSQRTGGCHR